jgi:hypothetical protein
MKILDVPMSGSANWRTASRNRNGQYLRNRSIPVQPRTEAQLAVRGFLALNSQNWAGLTNAQREAWATLAAGHPRTDALGQSYTLTGAQMFGSVNNIIRLMGATPVTTPPATPNLNAFVAGILRSTGSMSVTLSGYIRPADGQILIYCSRPRSAGVKFFGAPIFISATTGSTTTAIELKFPIEARVGALADGMILQITQVPVVGGIKGSPQPSLLTVNDI